MKPVAVLEPFADPSVLRSQGRETEARRSERFREDNRRTARTLDLILGLSERSRDETFRASLLWLESLRIGGATDRDRRMATILHVALLVDGLPADPAAFWWAREIALYSKWERERDLALEVVERLVEAGFETKRGAS